MNEVGAFIFEMILTISLCLSVWGGIWLYNKFHPDESLGPKMALPTRPFVISEYYERMEKVSLEIQEEQEKKEKYYITLWWGLDGLRLYDNGTTKWISRRKQEPVNQNISYSSCQCILPQEIQTFNGCDIQQAPVDERTKYINSMIQQELQSYQIFNPYSQKYIQFSCPPAYATSMCNRLGGLPYEGNTCQLC